MINKTTTVMTMFVLLMCFCVKYCAAYVYVSRENPKYTMNIDEVNTENCSLHSREEPTWVYKCRSTMPSLPFRTQPTHYYLNGEIVDSRLDEIAKMQVIQREEQKKIDHEKGAKDDLNMFCFVGFLIIVGLYIYLMPTVIAFRKNHPQKWSIFAINLFLGESVIGWVGALVWALQN